MMKIKVRNLSYDEVLKLPRLKHKKPLKPSRFLSTVVRVVSTPTLKKTRFSYTTERMELVGKQPCLILMNHSSFTDFEIAATMIFPRPFNIVATTDGFVGKKWFSNRTVCVSYFFCIFAHERAKRSKY